MAVPTPGKLSTIWQELVIFGLALFLHSFIDGLTVGLFQNVNQIGIIGASIILHKVPVAFTLGFLFSRSGLTLRMWSTRIIFCLFIVSSPIGVAVGAVISDQLFDYALIIIQSFSAGTFLYLGCMDLLVHEFFSSESEPQSQRMKACKMLAVLVGWGFVVLLMTAIPAHEED